MNKKTEKIIVGLGTITAATVAAAAVSNKVTKTLVDVALARKQPEVTKKYTDTRKEKILSNDMTARFEECALKMKDLSMRDIEITADDGTNLIGHYYACAKPKRIVLAMHGWRSDYMTDFGMTADFLHNNNCDVLYVEQRGQGNSGGDYMGFGMTERFDCKNWVEWINENTEKLPVYLYGISMGSATVLMASGLELSDRVKGIIADCGYTSANDIFRHIAKNTLHVPYGVKSGEIETLCQEKIQCKTDEYSTLEALKTNKKPILFIHGTDDNFVPIEMTYENYKACNAPKRLLVVPGAQHACSYFIDTQKYENEVLSFFADFDR